MQVFFGVLAGVAVAVGVLALIVRDRLRRLSQQAFGTDDLGEALERQRRELSRTPKSVSAMTRLCLPQIERDHPEFSWEEARGRAEALLLSWFAAFDRQNAALLAEGTDELRGAVAAAIADEVQRGEHTHYERPRIHRTEIARYVREPGQCVIVFQSAAEAVHYVERGGRVVQGQSDLPEQGKYELCLTYLQDRDRAAAASGDRAAAVSCPHCGAPVSALGNKVCTYCGSPVVAINLHAWTFTGVRAL